LTFPVKTFEALTSYYEESLGQGAKERGPLV